MSNPSPRPTQTTRPKPFLLMLVIGIIAGVLSMCCVCGGLIYFFTIGNPLFETTELTEHDFPSNAERLNYLNGMLPVQLPPGTTINQLHVVGWQDWSIDIEGTIPPQDIDTFIQSLPSLDESDTDTFEGQVGADHIEIQIDRSTGQIVIHFIDM